MPDSHEADESAGGVGVMMIVFAVACLCASAVAVHPGGYIFFGLAVMFGAVAYFLIKS